MTERPRLWACTEALCWIARDILRKRMVGYPAALNSGKMSQAAADAGLRIAAAIARDWTRAIERAPVADFAPQPLPEPLDPRAVASQAERVATIQSALAHPAVQADRDYAEMVEALLWWERATERGHAPIAELNALNAAMRQLRAELKAA